MFVYKVLGVITGISLGVLILIVVNVGLAMFLEDDEGR